MRRGTLSAAVVAAAMLAVTGSAQATQFKPVKVGTAQQAATPAVAVDNSGNAVIAWADTGPAPNVVQYCVTKLAQGKCAQQGTLTPAAAQNVDNVQVFVEGTSASPTYVILADVFAASGDNPQQFSPEQEWQSTDGGANWVAQQQGLSIADGILNADTVPVNGVSGPGAGELGYGWDTASGAPTFQAFPVSNPPACGDANEPLPCDGGSFATLEPDSNPDTLGNAPGHFAATTGTSPGVFGVFDTNFTSGPLGCPNHFGTAFVYGAGNESATNDYNISPGQPGSAWKNALTQADCGTEYSTAAGGPSGFGILEENLDAKSVVYHAFDATADAFQSAPVTVNSANGDFDPTMNQDSAGGIYAVYFGGGDGAPVDLSYSGTQGQSFATVQLDPDSDGMEDNLASAVDPIANPGGDYGYAVWTDGNNVYELPFQAASVATPASVGSTATATSSSASVTAGCASYPCTITVTITVSVTVVVSHSAGHRHAHTLTLGSGKATLRKHGHITVHFTRKAERALHGRHGTLKVKASVKTTVQKQTVKRTRSLRLKVR